MAACPNCREAISYVRVRSRFECPSCHTLLVSNYTWVILIGFVSWAAVGSIAATSFCQGGLQSFWCFSLIDTFFGGSVAALVAVSLLSIKRVQQ